VRIKDNTSLITGWQFFISFIKLK